MPRGRPADSVHERFMRLAVAEAARARGRTSPNPIVGAVVVRDGRVVGAGHHVKAGLAHGEVDALDAAGEKARGGDLYVTLEPCDHFGRTPPCTRAVLASGVKRVYVGSRDPNPKVSGRGIRRLKQAGLEVQVGVLGAECDALNEGWFKFITTRMPWVVLKAAATLDGKLATAAGDSRWITSEPARALVHLWRDELDAVLVGIETALADDPRLTARPDPKLRPRRDGPARDPLRVVVDSRLRLPASARVLPALVACTAAAPGRRASALRRAGAEVIECRSARDGRVDLRDLLARLAARGIVSVLVEGGGRIHGSLLRQGIWDELRLFVAPKILGEGGKPWAALPAPRAMKDALQLARLACEPVGADVLLRARPQAARR